MLPTVADVLGLEAVRRGSPRVVAGAGRLATPVRWVHAIELADAARLLRGGELVLSTGIALPDQPARQARYVAELAGVGVSGLAVELGRRYTRALPAALVATAEERGLPLIAFEREVRFVDITEAVHAQIIDSQLAELRAADRLHEVFTGLSLAGAGPDEVIREAARLAGRPMILEDLSHSVLACDAAGADRAALLDGFPARSRLAGTAGGFAVPPPRTSTGHGSVFDQRSGWLITPVGARGEDWGRLIMVCSGPPAPLDTVLIERTATTLVLGRLQARQRESLARQAHRTLISAILSGDADPEEAAVRARTLGVPVGGRQLVALVARVRDPGAGLSGQARVLEVADALADACRAELVPAIVGSLDDARAAALLSLDQRADPDQVLGAICARSARRAADGAGTVLAVGSVAATMPAARRSFLEARQVADAVAADPKGRPPRPYYRLADLRLPGLLQLLRADPRVQGFTERELGPLLAYDAGHRTDLTGVLSAYLDAGGSKALAAQRAHLARPTLYERLRHIERILGVSLDSARSRTSLHVALLAHAAAQQPAAR